jgi:SAM-dependent methyltransferase
MKFYPNFTIYKYYKQNALDSAYFSKRIPDRTIKNSLDNLNRAMNVCEKNDTFLDFGAGNGRYSTALLPEFKKGYGIEVVKDPFLSQVAQDHPNFTAIFGENALSRVKEKIDLFILMDVIEHIPLDVIKKFVQQISAVQQKGGVVYISTPNAVRCGAVQKSGIYYKRLKYGHRKHYLSDELIDLFSTQGYKPILVTYEDFSFRLFIKQFNLGFSFLDRKLINIPLYRYVSIPFILFINAIFILIGIVVSWDEYRNRHDQLSSQTIMLTLKKVS